MNLIIDDDMQRVAGFRRALGSGAHSAIAYPGAAADLRSDTPYTLILLDHDGVDGERLARLMADEQLQTQARVVIHSSNYLGACRMRDMLKETHRVEMSSYNEICKDAV